jgi:hypothetical protein
VFLNYRAERRNIYATKKLAEAYGKRPSKNSSNKPVPIHECCSACTAGKKPRHMTSDEFKQHKNALRQLSRMNQSSQKKTARLMKRRRLYSEKKERARKAELELSEVMLEKKGDKLRQSHYQLNYEVC